MKLENMLKAANHRRYQPGGKWYSHGFSHGEKRIHVCSRKRNAS